MKILENEKNFTILEHDEKCYLISYTTTIAIYDYITRNLKMNALYWNCSQTTIKHFKHFINNYTCFNYDNKKQFEIEAEEDAKIEMIINLH